MVTKTIHPIGLFFNERKNTFETLIVAWQKGYPI